MNWNRAAILLALVSALQTGWAREKCANSECTADVRPDLLKTWQPSEQETIVWCWAASIANIFKFYGYEVSQNRIVTEAYGSPVVSTGAPHKMTALLNRDWVDDTGKRFRVTSKIHDAVNRTSRLSSDQVVAHLIDDKPVFFATTNHAMVLTHTTYGRVGGMIVPLSGRGFDPFPSRENPKGTIRTLSQRELTFFYVALVEVQGDSTKMEDSSNTPDCMERCDKDFTACVEKVKVDSRRCVESFGFSTCKACGCPNWPIGNFACRDACQRCFDGGRICKQRADDAVDSCGQANDRCESKCSPR